MVGKKLKASSILEVVIAMVLIVVVFGIAMMIIANVTHKSVSGEQLHAQAVLKSLPIDAWTDNQTQVIDSVVIQQRIEPYKLPGLTAVHLTGYNTQKKKLAEIRRIIIDP